MSRFRWLIVLTICFSLTGTIFAQRSPKLGQPLPDVSAYDADGKPFKLSSLKGRYTVVAFGCLT
jgi:cytochrome oxidase Cu insertion factor (SCO1/SenC/PrrC family)